MVELLIGERTVERFGCVPGEIVLADEAFPISSLGRREYHNAYDADENGPLVRLDVVFTNAATAIEVPAFAARDRTGAWRWLVRFQPTACGEWTGRVRVLTRDLTQRVTAFGFDDRDYRASPGAEQRLTVVESMRPGPLEIAAPAENRNYFHRLLDRNGRRAREPFFLAGCCRPWVADDAAWESGLDRDRELLAPMARAGCNVLYHWLAPWETQIVHQDAGEDVPLACKGFDQERAQRVDQLLDLAEKHGILVFIAVMPHPSLRDARHPWGGDCWSGRGSGGDAGRCNGFQRFAGPRGEAITIDEFFQADPTGAAGDWSRRLWKHWANYWRYLIARWGAHPALGSWVLLDEMEGIGSSDTWWWDNRSFTYRWHDALVAMIRGRLRWTSDGLDLPYSGDYLRHPLTSSTTHYQSPRRAAGLLPDDAALMEALANVSELPGHGDWNGHQERLDYVSHHAYPFVPCRGRWTGLPGDRAYHVRRLGRRGPVRWERSNSSHARLLNADRWLWDAICTRLAAWSRANAASTRLITEYGCLERLSPAEAWDEYGRRVPGFTHFANWAALALGMAGTPFKWNDGAAFGEMAARTSHGRPSAVWNGEAYPPDSYAEMTSLMTFVARLDLAALLPKPHGGRVIDEHGRELPHLSVFALAAADGAEMMAWLYDRTFESNGRDLARSLVLVAGAAARRYEYACYDTWAGQPLPDASGTVVSGDAGQVVIRLPAFPRTSRPAASGADGNDLAMRLWS